ncbi:CGLD27 family protein [Lusitaniella coriacea LEGE 07157]|uniref:CGLD27 family protein n=1 Tax=Lusitaniella coriacea LEGE 07157 TaxID=945747 RepID=A0A8J7E221_9CYAN|nr:CGLD27 family protein [Lusitaniella coriacea]MBE9117494.1 CGLD27 family protein [Lusitaniella coriacea LEGE 07157]
MKNTSTAPCPVPNEQQPVNEYEQLKDAFFFSWTTLGQVGYLRKLVWVWAWSWIVAGPIAAASFPLEKYPLRFGLLGGGGALIGLILVLSRLYLGWSYVRDRLRGERVFYEESGWYDGQTWQKPPQILARDRLIVAYEIQPQLDRLKQTFAVVALLIGVGCLLWLIL